MKFRVKRGMDVAMEYKSMYLVKRRKKIWVSEAEAILKEKGIQVVNAKDVLGPALTEEPYVPLANEKVIPKEKPLCYMLSNKFRPLALLEQCQLITNSLVFDFPVSILERVKESTNEEKEVLKDIALQSHILDTEQIKLQRELEPIKYPGYRPPRKFGITKEKKVENLVHHWALALERSQSKKESRHILHRAASKVTLKHHDKLMHLDHMSRLLLCARIPMEPLLGSDEVKAFNGSPLPDIYPLSPFIHSENSTDYDDNDAYAVPGALLAPHTVFMGHIPPPTPDPMKPEQFHGMSLVYAFSFAASYAREMNKSLDGDLKKPVTLNIVHTDGRDFHIGRFQLNTLDCSSPVRNIFWHEHRTPLFENIGYEAAKPTVESLNTRPFDLLKALFS